MLAVHRDNHGIPDLGAEDLGLVFDVHVSSRKQLGIDALRQTGKNIAPRGPDRDAELEGLEDREDGVPDYVPQIGIQKKENQVCEEHDDNREDRHNGAQRLTQVLVLAVGDTLVVQSLEGILKGASQEEVGLDKLAGKD